MQGISAAAAMIGNVRQRSRMLSAAISSTVTRELRNATRDLSDEEEEEDDEETASEEDL